VGKEQLGISGEIVGPVVRALEEAGVDARRLAVEAGPIVAGGRADAVIDAAAAQLRDPALGLTLARRLPIGSLGILDYALCTSACLGDALARVAKFYGVVTQRVTLALVTEGDRASLVFERKPGDPHSRHWAEFASAMITARVRQTLGRPAPLSRVAFAHPAPASTATHDAFFGVPVAWSAPCDLLELPASLLPLPLLTAASSLGQALEDKMRELAPALGEPDPLVARVRVAVAKLLDDRITTLDAVAGQLRLTRRTLQRELKTRGTSHTQLLDDARRERALRLLEDGKLSVTEVAYRLGLSEPSAFFRAFRRWTGTSPTAFRKGTTERP
jgi:AraC-like DNA-binding protein